MFNETATDTITVGSMRNPANLPIQGGGPCGANEVAVDVGADAAVCMTQNDINQTFYTAHPPATSPLALSGSTWPWVIAIGVTLIALMSGGRR